MSSLLTPPLIMLNMGGEMVYILAQRLDAQKVSAEKSQRVMHDVLKSLFETKFIEELFKPQEIYPVTLTRKIFEKLAHSSIMRLSESSMDKLFDLMTMGVKQQLLVSTAHDGMLKVLRIHVREMKALATDPAILALASSCERLIEDTYGNLSQGEWNALRQTLSGFFRGRRVKVSLFLQEGMQASDARIRIRPPVSEMRDPVGTLRMFDENGRVSSTSVLPGCAVNMPCEFYLHPVEPGGNLYAKDRPPANPPASLARIVTPPTRPRMCTIARPAASSSAKPGEKQAASTSAHANAPAASSKSGPAEELMQNARGGGTAKKEMNLLASLIGTNEAPKDAFKLNLFNMDGDPDPAGTSDYVNSFFNSKNSIESDPVPVHEFDGAQRRGGADQLAGIMSGFDDLDVSKGGDGGDDDLLDLMDAAAGN